MRLVFAGTPHPAVPSLRALAGTGHDIATVVTRTDAPVGRRRTLTPSPVADAAAEFGLDVLNTDRLDDETTATLAALQPDLGVIVAYGALVREPLLSTPRHGWVNLHFSLLPRWRGAAPVQHALIAGDRETGVSVFQLTPGLDTGDVFADERAPIRPGTTAGELLDELAVLGAGVLQRVVDAIAEGTAASTPQRGTPTTAPKLTSADGLVDWTRPAREVLDRIAGTTPEPGAHTTVRGERVKILAAGPSYADGLVPGEIALSGRTVVVGAGDHAIALERVQPAGRSAMAATDWFRGLRGAPRAGS